MLYEMRERGPDALRVIHARDLTLGFSRLAIVGRAGATQPLESEAAVCAINGEIYNYRELWRSFPETLHTSTPDLTSDCAVLLPLIERNPSHFLDELDGIFAGIVFNGERLTLFRDHVGIKPMFYARPSFGTAFASTVAGLRPVIEPVVNRASMRTYLECGYVKTPTTLLARIRSVPPGATVSFQAPSGGGHVRPWFDARKNAAGEQSIRQFIESAVVSEIPDDWPAVSTLSGGVDSSLVTLLLHKAGAVPNALTVRYAGLEDDVDLETARRLCKDFGIKHIEVPVSPDDYMSEVLDTWRFDQPIADPNAIALNRLCQQTRLLGSRVLLTGDGADELFCGYDYYDRPARGGLHGYLAAWTFSSMADSKDRLFVRRITGLPRLRQLRPRLREPLRYVQEFDLRSWLEPNLLAKADRFGMAEHVEVRVPFLRPTVVATALALPSHRKLEGSITKVALKAAFRDLLPRYVVERAKQGFPCPISEWLRGDAGHILQASATWSVGDTWSVAKEQELWREHLSGQRDWGQQLWRLVVARAWWLSVCNGQQAAVT
jgi:asparagine synthase (glutamine-hydrolysing)